MITLKRLNEIATVRGNEICISDGKEKYTWYDIIRLTESRMVFLLRSFNAEQLRSACYLSKNSTELICWLAAFATLGIPVNGLDYSLPVKTLSTLINRVNPGLLIISFSLYTPDEINAFNANGISMLAIDAPIDSVVSSVGELHHSELNSLLSTHIYPPFRAVSLTSGTSSVPKIVLRYRSFDSRRFTWFTERFNFTHRDGFMLILPLCHAAGNGWARMFMGLGAPLYLVDQDDEPALAYVLSVSAVKASVMTPNLVARMLNLAGTGRLQHNLRWVLVGGSYFPVKSKQCARAAFGNIFCEYYGCTETGVNILSDPADMSECPESVGRAFNGNRVMILDEDNIPLGANKNGRVAIASYMLMDEYGDGSKPFTLIDGERYFLMADYGYLDDGGRLFLMNRNGENHCVYDVHRTEEHIRSLPCVKDVALVAVPLRGESHIRCIFSTNQNRVNKFTCLIKKINEQAIRNGIINFTAFRVEKIPYSPSGKVRFSEIIRIPDAA